jgi:hypothetical protein
MALLPNDTPYDFGDSFDNLNDMFSGAGWGDNSIGFESGGEGRMVDEFSTDTDYGELFGFNSINDNAVPGVDSNHTRNYRLLDRSSGLSQPLQQNDNGDWVNYGTPRQWYNPMADLASAFSTVAPMIPAAGVAAQLGVTNPIASQAINQGFKSGLGSMFLGGDPLKAGAFGAAAGGLQAGVDSFNPGTEMFSDKGVGNIFNKGLSGGLTSALGGGNFAQGALGGAMKPTMNYVGDKVDNFFGIGGDGLGAYGEGLDKTLGDLQGQSRIPGWQQGNSDFSSVLPGLPNQPQQSYGQNFYPDADPDFSTLGGGGGTSSGGGSREQTSSLQGNPLMDFLGSGIRSMGGAANIGDMAGGLMGIYSSIRKRRDARDQAQQLSSMFGPNSAYSKQLQQSLARRDAAAGRRSQYGPRNVELQARLAEMNSRNAPAIAAANQTADQGLNSIFNNVLNVANKGGLFKRLDQMGTPSMTQEQMSNWGRDF